MENNIDLHECRNESLLDASLPTLNDTSATIALFNISSFLQNQWHDINNIYVYIYFT